MGQHDQADKAAGHRAKATATTATDHTAAPQAFDFVISAGAPAQVAQAIAALPSSARAAVIERVHAIRGNDFAAHVVDAMQPVPEAAPIGQRTPLDPLGQSRTPIASGQSFADATRDADDDGQADLFTAAAGKRPSFAPRGTDRAHQLAAYAATATTAAKSLAVSIVPSYVGARDALDLATLQQLATEVITAYEQIRLVGAELAPYAQPTADASSPDAAADHGRLMPAAGTLDAAIAIADAQLAAHIGPTEFRGRVILGAHVGAMPGNPQRALGYLFEESIRTGAVVAAVIQVRDLIPPDTVIPPALARTLADAIAPHAARPVHFAFIKTALSALGLWHLVEHATASDGRPLAQVDHDATAQAARFGAEVDLGGFQPDQALALLRPKPDDPNTYEVSEPRGKKVFDLIASVPDPEARGAILDDLDRRHLLEPLVEVTTFAYAKRAHEGLPPQGFGHVRATLRHRVENQDTTDRSVSHYLDEVPVIGGGLDIAANVFTFGFVEQHDEAYRAMRAGEISDVDYENASNNAALRAIAVGAVSTATGGAAGAYAEGLTAGLAARGIAGRIAAGTLTGAAAGAGAGFGTRLGNDLLDQELSSGSEYLADIGKGAAVGGALGGTLTAVGAAGSAIARRLPDRLKTPIHWLAERFPVLEADSDFFGALRELGARHSQGLVTFVTNPAAALRLIRAGVADANAQALAFFQTLGPETALAGDARIRLTVEARGNLHEPGPLRPPALHIQHAERLGDDVADHLADDLGRAGPSHGSLFDDYGADSNLADDASHWLDGSGLNATADDIAHIGDDAVRARDLPPRYRDLLDEHEDGLTIRDHSDARQSGIVPEPDALNTEQHHVFPKETKHAEFFRARGLDENKIHDYTIDIDEQLHQFIHVGRDEWEQEWSAAIIKNITAEEEILGYRLNVDEMEGVARDLMDKYRIPRDLPFRRWQGAPKTKAPAPKVGKRR